MHAKIFPRNQPLAVHVPRNAVSEYVNPRNDARIGSKVKATIILVLPEEKVDLEVDLTPIRIIVVCSKLQVHVG